MQQRRFSILHSLICASLLACTISGMTHAQKPGNLEERILGSIKRQGEAEGLSNKKFDSDAAGFTSKQFKANSFLDAKAFNTTNYKPKKFLGIPIPWTKDKTSFQSKTFEAPSAAFLEKNWSQTDEKVSGANKSYVVKPAEGIDTDSQLQNKKASSKGATEGYWATFRETATRDLSFEEVKELINTGKKK